MKVRPTDLAQYELLHGSTEYPYEFTTAPCTELSVDLFSDRPCSIFLHVIKGSIDRWVAVVSGQRRIELRGRFSNVVGLAIHSAKEATINALVVGHPVGLDKIDYTPAVMHTEMPVETPEDRLRREFKAMLDARFPQPERKKDVDIDPELMGDEIPEVAGKGFEIDDDDPLDPEPWVVRYPDESDGDPAPSDNRTGPDTARGSSQPSGGGGNEPPASDKPPAAPASS